MEKKIKALAILIPMIFVCSFLESSVTASTSGIFQKPDKRGWYDGHVVSGDYTPVQALSDDKQIYSAITIDMDYQYQWPKGKGKCYASAMLYHSSSKISLSSNIKDLDYLLRHEQGHFDLAEYETRLLNKAILDVTDWRVVNKIYIQYLNKFDSLSRWYDIKTEYSKNEAQQQLWRNKINDWMHSAD